MRVVECLTAMNRDLRWEGRPLLVKVNFVSLFVWQITSSNTLTLFCLTFLFSRVKSGDENLRDNFSVSANATYRSNSTQAELIEIIGHQIRDGVIKQCKHQGVRL